jgi:hypothetical protein
VVTVKEIFGNIWPKRAAKGQALIITKPFAPKGALQGGKVYTQFEEQQPAENQERRAAASSQQQCCKRKHKDESRKEP